MKAPALTTEQAVQRLATYSERLRQSVYQAMSLYACFQALNDSPEPRTAVNTTPAKAAANIIQHAMLRELILILVRVFDGRGHYPLEATDKVSFPVILEWVTQPLIEADLIAKARLWFADGHRANENETSVKAAIDQLRSSLARLDAEIPNRQQRLRDFRDGFLAHELRRDIPRDPPLFGDISSLLDEIRLLSEAVSLAIEGKSTHWDNLEDECRGSADWLWDRVAKPTS